MMNRTLELAVVALVSAGIGAASTLVFMPGPVEDAPNAGVRSAPTLAIASPDLPAKSPMPTAPVSSGGGAPLPAPAVTCSCGDDKPRDPGRERRIAINEAMTDFNRTVGTAIREGRHSDAYGTIDEAWRTSKDSAQEWSIYRQQVLNRLGSLADDYPPARTLLSGIMMDEAARFSVSGETTAFGRAQIAARALDDSFALAALYRDALTLRPELAQRNIQRDFNLLASSPDPSILLDVYEEPDPVLRDVERMVRRAKYFQNQGNRTHQQTA